MITTPRLLNRKLHRVGIFMLMVGITVLIVLEWLSRLASRLVHAFMALPWFARIEPWLKRRSLWFAIPAVVVSACMFFVFEFGQYPLFASGHFWLGVSAHILKWPMLAVSSYFLHLYKDKLLEVSWMCRFYNWYQKKKKWLNEQAWYRRAVALKVSVKMALLMLRYDLRQRLEAYKHRRSMIIAARRTRDVRVRKGQCWSGP